MEPIYPLTETRISQFNGYPVCVVKQDGTRHIGILSACRGGKVRLNGAAGASSDHPNKSRRLKKTKTAAQRPIDIQAPVPNQAPYAPGNGLGPALTFDLARIAYIFLLV